MVSLMMLSLSLGEPSTMTVVVASHAGEPLLLLLLLLSSLLSLLSAWNLMYWMEVSSKASRKTGL